jgi:hypothetical protein
MKTNLQRLTAAYHKASYALIEERNKCFPVGTKVRCKIYDLTATVITGSQYADQVRTTIGHCSPQSLEIINEN